MLIIAIILMFFVSAAANAAVTFQWPDQPPGSPPVEGYRVYQVIKTQPSPEGPEIITYQQANTTKIGADVRSWTTDLATAGTIWTIRAYNVGGEGPDSQWFEVPAPPAQVPEFKAIALLVQSSPDMIKWGTIAVINVSKEQRQQFFRLNF